jgi:hypothetical protein
MVYLSLSLMGFVKVFVERGGKGRAYGMPLIIFSNSSHHGVATLLRSRTSAINCRSFSVFDLAMFESVAGLVHCQVKSVGAAL